MGKISFVHLICVSLLLSPCINIRSVEGTREAVSQVDEKAIDWVELGHEIASKVNHGFDTMREEAEDDEDDEEEDPCVSDPDLPECEEDGDSSKTI